MPEKSHAFAPISVHMELASLKLYMGDGVLLTMKPGMAQQLAARGYELFSWEGEGSTELDFVLQKNTAATFRRFREDNGYCINKTRFFEELRSPAI